MDAEERQHNQELIAGPSGAGKSLLVYAGIAPQLEGDADRNHPRDPGFAFIVVSPSLV